MCFGTLHISAVFFPIAVKPSSHRTDHTVPYLHNKTTIGYDMMKMIGHNSEVILSSSWNMAKNWKKTVFEYVLLITMVLYVFYFILVSLMTRQNSIGLQVM